MKLKELLNEARHREDISIEKAIELIRANCKDALKNVENPMWRGFRGREDAYLIQADLGERASKNTSNYYTIILDKFLPKQGYPKRSKSIICGNNKNLDYAEGYGAVYALFPYDGVPIGICHERDIWETKRFVIGDAPRARSIEDWNSVFERSALSDDTYENFKEDIIKHMDIHPGSEIEQIFKRPENIDMYLEAAYSPGSLNFDLTTTAMMDQYEDKDRECWLGGKCVAIQYGTWKKTSKKWGL